MEQPHVGSFYRLEQEWGETTEITLSFPMEAVVAHRPRSAVTIERGPLVYGLNIGDDWQRVNEDKPYHELPHADYEVYPTTPWNYALDISEGTLQEDLNCTEHPLGENPFSPDGSPISCTIKGGRVQDWQLKNGSVGEMPKNPVTSTEPLEELTLLPYGCTNLRVTEFPVCQRMITDLEPRRLRLF